MKSFPKDPLFESFTLPIFDLNYQYNHRALVANVLNSTINLGAKGRRALYVHIPFCDTICSFCPFIKSGWTESRTERYISALIKEIKLASQYEYYKDWELDNIYFGGGTPSVLTSEQFIEIRNAIFSNFKVKADAEFSIEVEPKSVSEEKFKTYASLGVTRVSWGVQTFDQDIRRMVNLTATEEQIRNTADLAKKYFKGDNFDMIVGFPGQSVDDAVKEMERAISLGTRSVSLYPFDYVTALPSFLDKIRCGAIPEAPTSQVRWDSFFESREVLLSKYSEQNMYSFGEKSSPDSECKYMFKVLYGTYFDETIGVGCGAYSSIMGLTYHNVTDEKEYVQNCLSDQQPIALSSPGHIYEKGLVYFPKRLSLSKEHMSAVDLNHTYLDKLNYLLDEELIIEDVSCYQLTKKGKRNYISIMVYMMSDYQRRLYERTCSRLKDNLNWDVSGPASLKTSSKKSLGVKNTLLIVESKA